jgi:D-3-phosphoglycerate dehydrogenase / 2-oxoglutarate reductase
MKILIIDDVHPIFMKQMNAAGYICDYRPEIDKALVMEILKDYQGLVVRTKFPIDKEIIDAGKELKFIARAGAGMDNVNESYANSKKIICFNAPEGNRDAVAEHAIGMLLSLFRKINQSNQQIRNGIWDRDGNRGVELKGKTVGIIGYGNTGKALARKLSGFEVTVIAYDKYLYGYSDNYVQEVTLDELKYRSDIISLHVPLTMETEYMIDEKFISELKKAVYLINTSRGKVLKTSSVTNLMKSGRILGICVDVLENERLNSFTDEEKKWFDELAERENVIMTSHIAGWTFESYRKISEVLAEKIIENFSLS